jgi:hypothetical protein
MPRFKGYIQCSDRSHAGFVKVTSYHKNPHPQPGEPVTITIYTNPMDNRSNALKVEYTIETKDKVVAWKNMKGGEPIYTPIVEPLRFESIGLGGDLDMLIKSRVDQITGLPCDPRLVDPENPRTIRTGNLIYRCWMSTLYAVGNGMSILDKEDVLKDKLDRDSSALRETLMLEGF